MDATKQNHTQTETSTLPKDHKFLASLIRDVTDFPKPGIVYKDITPLLANPRGLAIATELLAHPLAGQSVDIVVGIESRGFIFGAALATRLGAGFVPARKPGKLPAATHAQTYALEYGEDILEIHQDAFASGARVLICDDLIATGGTAQATGKLVNQLGGALVGYSVIIELAFLNGRAQLGDAPVHSLITYG